MIAIARRFAALLFVALLLEDFFVVSGIESVNQTLGTGEIQHGSKQPNGTGENNPNKPRMVTREELASHSGKFNGKKSLWISILSEVFDVTSAPHFYAKGRTYHIFVGRDANVPFITGEFTEEEAAKPILSLDDHDLWNLDNFFKETYRPEKEKPKYPFVGYLVGDMYNEDGTPTELLLEVRKRIAREDIEKQAYLRRIDELVKERETELAQQETEERRIERIPKFFKAIRNLFRRIKNFFMRGKEKTEL